MGINDDMKTSQNGLEFISKWEGCVLKPYKDIAGLRTIGIGHLIKPGEIFPDGVEISKEKALDILSKDVKLCEDAIKKAITVHLAQNQFDALVSFGFNCGIGVYTTSGACKVLNAGNYTEVPTRLLEWSKAKINGVSQVNQGLYNRRKAEGELFSKISEDSSNPTVEPAIQQQDVIWTVTSLKEAQCYLKKLGLYNLNVDGLWGPGTSAALTKFATNSNLTLGSTPKTKIPFEVFSSLKSSAGKK